MWPWISPRTTVRPLAEESRCDCGTECPASTTETFAYALTDTLMDAAIKQQLTDMGLHMIVAVGS
jgi:hypothetical protein